MAKPCKVCGVIKTLDEFDKSKDYKDGRTNTCKVCHRDKYRDYYATRYVNEPEKHKAWASNYRKKNPEKVARCIRKNAVKRKYGLSLEDVERMKKEQNGLCAVVGCGNDAQVIDHCHATGKVRGLLCGGCNSALGFLKEDFSRIIGLAMYTQTHKNKGV